MTKNKYVLLPFFLIYLAFMPYTIVNAEYKCVYDVTYSGTSGSRSTETIGFNVNPDDKTVAFDRKYALLNSVEKAFFLDEIIDNSKLLSETVEELEGKCPSNVYVCSFVHMAPGANNSKDDQYGFLFNPTLYSSIPDGAFDVTIPGKGYYYRSKKPDDCPIGKYNSDESTAEESGDIFECDYYNDLINGTIDEDGLKSLYCKIDEEDCTIRQIALYKEKKEKLRKFCQQIMRYSDYINPCVQTCSNFSKDISIIENDDFKGQCGFSDRLLAWVNNILKWIKYVLPVIVIVLGIIDFIKAMASEKDDEMKKAQKRFIIRVISAALAFIVPLIITFILEKMGFTADSCGLW